MKSTICFCRKTEHQKIIWLKTFCFGRFDSCGFDERCCETVSSALQSSNSHLTELDLSNNDLKDSGVKLLSDGLKSQHCQLNILRFDFHFH